MAVAAFDAKKLHADYDGRHPDDRSRMFGAVAAVTDAHRVLYPGSYIDVAPSYHFDHVTYVDTDRRAARFFAQRDDVDSIIATNRQPSRAARPHQFTFHHGDYTDPLPVDVESVDLLISLYAGFVSEHCLRYLSIGGKLLVNSSHGDAAMAAIDPRLRLIAVVHQSDGRYRVGTDRLDEYLIPKRGTPPTREELHHLGRGIAYTRSASAYLFERSSR